MKGLWIFIKYPKNGDEAYPITIDTLISELAGYYKDVDLAINELYAGSQVQNSFNYYTAIFQS